MVSYNNNYQGTTNPNYFAQITNHDPNDGGTVIGPMPDHFSLRIQSDWEATLASYMDQGSFGKARAALSQAVGSVPYVKALTGQIWRGSQPIGFELTLQFDAFTNTILDVSNPVMHLMAWASPKRVGGFLLQAPGPTIIDPSRRISVRIGRFLYFDNVVMPSVDVTWVTAPDKPGQYIGADVALSFVTFFTPDRDDILAYFGQGASGSDALIDDPTSIARNAVYNIFHPFGG